MTAAGQPRITASELEALGVDPDNARALSLLSRTAPPPVPLVPGLEGQDEAMEAFATWNGPRMGAMPDRFAHRSPYEMLVVHARLTKGSPLPSGFGRGVPKQCYWNALELAQDSDGEWVYAEGLALGQFWPMEHAWCVRADDPAVVADPTWDTPEKAWYLGIAFDARWLVSQEVPLIDAWAKDWPLLREGVQAEALHRFPGSSTSR